MKSAFVIMIMTFCFQTGAQVKVLNQITEDEQKYFKSRPGDGFTRVEREERSVKEINKLHSEIQNLRSELNQLRKEVEALKADRKS